MEFDVYEPFLLMLMPALLIFVGMVMGFVLWSWARGIDQQVVDDLQSQIDQLRKEVAEIHDGGDSEMTDTLPVTSTRYEWDQKRVA